jgi:hypothetical protein
MMRKFRVFALASIAFTGPITLLAQDTNQQPSTVVMKAVEATFPKELRYPKDQESGNVYKTCAEVYSKNVDGTPNLIATAYSGYGIEVAMVAYKSGVANIVFTVPNEQCGLEGGECGLGIVNLADSEHPDSSLAKTIAVAFHDGRPWFFTWDGKKLQNITALIANNKVGGIDTPASAMGVGEAEDVVDIDHAGAMQILGINGFETFEQDDGIMSSGTYTLFRYNGKIYAPAKTLIAIDKFESNLLNTPMGIGMHQTPAPSYQLTIVNGDRDGSNRVTSAKVEVNGVTVIQSTEINQNVEMLTRTIQLQKESEINVTVDGPAKSHLYVVVE